jgi:para-aminobenzoate synthetase component 2
VARILVIDNYDSFVYNLVQYLEQLGAECIVRRNDAITVEDVEPFDVQGILLSPGPGVPADAGITEPLIRWVAGRIPVLGVCLGHQAIAEVYGGVVDRADELLHGRTSLVRHDNDGVFEGLPDPVIGTRYHSLAVVDGTVSAELVVTARTVPPGGGQPGGGQPGGVIMGLRHREHQIEGVQFHPESVLTQGGHQLLANWLRICGDGAAATRVPPLATEVERLRVAAG